MLLRRPAKISQQKSRAPTDGDAHTSPGTTLVKWGTKAELWTLYGPSEPMAHLRQGL